MWREPRGCTAPRSRSVWLRKLSPILSFPPLLSPPPFPFFCRLRSSYYYYYKESKWMRSSTSHLLSSPQSVTHTAAHHTPSSPVMGRGRGCRPELRGQGKGQGSRQAWVVPLMLLPRATILGRKQPPYAVLRYYRH